ncbi:MAG: hypothetical protein QOI58_481 [Thermoanaerobaculia bacterium]|jgi:hypothetical protein|nr:hypothetical protein [Thermoanaerobaculia bacterium]
MQNDRMSNLLDEAYAAAKKLPEEDQDAIGAVLLAEIDANRRWDELLAQPSEVIERMADRALEHHRLGLTLPLDPEDL